MRRETLHLIRPASEPDVRRLEHESDWHYERRCEAITALGVRWVRHPAYEFHPRHSTNPAVWKPAFAVAWADVLRRAEADRQRNPAFVRAQRVRAAVEPV